MGNLDAAFNQLVPAILGVFSDTPAVFTRSSSTYDPANDTNVVTTLTASVLTSPPEGFSLRYINGTTVQSGDRRITTVADYGALTAPQVGDKVVRGELDAVIVAVSPVNSGDKVVAYELQVRT
jgi:hypothetical protein